MTDNPTPTQPHATMTPAELAAFNEHARAVLHPYLPAYPTHDELHRYAVAWGESQVKYLTDWRYWEKLQDETLEIIRKMSVDLDAARAERDALRSRLALANGRIDGMIAIFEIIAGVFETENDPADAINKVGDILQKAMDAADLDRLTRDGGGR